MTLRITIQEAGSRRAFGDVEIPVPTAPPAGPDGGRWKWIGTRKGAAVPASRRKIFDRVDEHLRNDPTIQEARRALGEAEP